MSQDQPPEGEEERRQGVDDSEERRGEAPPLATEPAAPVPPEPPLARRLPLGRLVLGLVLVALGAIWLLEALDVVSFSFLSVLPAALIVVGVFLVARARTGRNPGLVVLGIVLTVILTFASGFDIKLRGGAGDRTERPTTLAGVQREYHLSLGQLTLDFREVDFSGGRTRVTASVGIGELTVRVPEDAAVVATGHVGAGQVRIFGGENDGLDADLSIRSHDFDVEGTGVLTLDLSVGLGQIEVSD